MKAIIYNVAKNGIIILYFLSIALLWNKNNFLCYYLIGIIINLSVNYVLKGIIKQKRPTLNEEDIENKENKEDINDATNSIVINDKNVLLNDLRNQYGMPSGHAQGTFFSAMFMTLSLQNIYISIIFFIISFITIYQRVHFYFHTVEQVIVGGLLGSLIAYVFYNLSLKHYFSWVCKHRWIVSFISFILMWRLF